MNNSFTLKPTPPFDFELTAGHITFFSGRYGTDVFEDGVFWRLLDLNGRFALASVRSDGTLDAPVLRVELLGDGLSESDIAEAERQIARAFGVEDDLAPFYAMARDDAHLSLLVKAGYGLHIPLVPSVYEGLIFAILGQQISTHVARILRTGLIERYGRSIEIDGERYHLFPRPEAIVEAGIDGLRAIKFSQRKAEYIADISAKVVSGELDLEGLQNNAPDDVARTLTSIRGVGEWTVNWLFIRATGHPDGFPHGDLALQRNLGRLVNGGAAMSAQDALDYSKRWSPLRTYVTTYLFAATRSGRFDALIEAGETGI